MMTLTAKRTHQYLFCLKWLLRDCPKVSWHKRQRHTKGSEKIMLISVKDVETTQGSELGDFLFVVSTVFPITVIDALCCTLRSLVKFTGSWFACSLFWSDSAEFWNTHKHRCSLATAPPATVFYQHPPLCLAATLLHSVTYRHLTSDPQGQY